MRVPSGLVDVVPAVWCKVDKNGERHFDEGGAHVPFGVEMMSLSIIQGVCNGSFCKNSQVSLTQNYNAIITYFDA